MRLWAFQAVAFFIAVAAIPAAAQTPLAEQEATAALFDCLRGASATAWAQAIPPAALEIFLSGRCLGLKALATEEYIKSYRAATRMDDVRSFADAQTDFATRQYLNEYKKYWDEAHATPGSRKNVTPRH